MRRNWWDEIEGLTVSPSRREVGVLRELYLKLGGTGWGRSSGWHPCTPRTSEDLYEYKPQSGVLWRNGRVAALDLHANGLKGDVPQSLEELRELRSLNLFGNELYGSLRHLTSLSPCLIHLDLSRNHIEGEFTDAMCRSLRSLRRLHLEYNNLSGPLPANLGCLGDLEVFTANHNRLYGPIPSGIRGCLRLASLWLHQNRNICGPVPIALAECPSLTTVYLSHTAIRELPANWTTLCRSNLDVQISPKMAIYISLDIDGARDEESAEVAN